MTVHITNHNKFEKGVGAFITNLEHLTLIMDAEGNMKMDMGQMAVPPQTEVEQPQEERAEEKCELEEEPQPAQQAEEVEELCHFVHPSVDSQQEWDIHREIKRLVSRQGIQEICQYLLQMRKEHKVLLPQVADKAYDELVRMGMPNDEGYSLKTFMKYYKR